MTPLLAQLYAMRAQLEAAIALAERDQVAPAEEEPAVCHHPADRQRDATTFGGPPKIICLDCGLTHPGTVV